MNAFIASSRSIKAPDRLIFYDYSQDIVRVEIRLIFFTIERVRPYIVVVIHVQIHVTLALTFLGLGLGRVMDFPLTVYQQSI